MIRLRHWPIARSLKRQPDVIIGGSADPYLLRWYVTPWRGWWRHIPDARRSIFQRAVIAAARLLPNVYVHCFVRSDDDRALHDHPWLFNASWLLSGCYDEHTIDAGGIHRRRRLEAGSFRFRLGRAPHRVELTAGDCWTLFVTGPVVRNWGFHCPDSGWIPWQRFTFADDPGQTGKGCEG